MHAITSNFRKAFLLRLVMSALIAVSTLAVGVHSLSTSNRMRHAVEARYPSLVGSPVDEGACNGCTSMSAGYQVNDVDVPTWKGVRGNVKFASMEAFGARPGEAGTFNPSLTHFTAQAGQPLDFMVKVLASNTPASSFDKSRGSGKHRDWRLVPAQNLTTVHRALPVVNTSARSPITVQEQSSGVLHISVPAIKGMAQEAWVYPQIAGRYPNGTWQVILGVGAAPQAEIEAYNDAQGKSSWLVFAAFLAFVASIGSVFYLISLVLDHHNKKNVRRRRDAINNQLASSNMARRA